MQHSKTPEDKLLIGEMLAWIDRISEGTASSDDWAWFERVAGLVCDISDPMHPAYGGPIRGICSGCGKPIKELFLSPLDECRLRILAVERADDPEWADRVTIDIHRLRVRLVEADAEKLDRIVNEFLDALEAHRA